MPWSWSRRVQSRLTWARLGENATARFAMWLGKHRRCQLSIPGRSFRQGERQRCELVSPRFQESCMIGYSSYASLWLSGTLFGINWIITSCEYHEHELLDTLFDRAIELCIDDSSMLFSSCSIWNSQDTYNFAKVVQRQSSMDPEDGDDSTKMGDVNIEAFTFQELGVLTLSI